MIMLITSQCHSQASDILTLRKSNEKYIWQKSRVPYQYRPAANKNVKLAIGVGLPRCRRHRLVYLLSVSLQLSKAVYLLFSSFDRITSLSSASKRGEKSDNNLTVWQLILLNDALNSYAKFRHDFNERSGSKIEWEETEWWAWAAWYAWKTEKVGWSMSERIADGDLRGTGCRGNKETDQAATEVWTESAHAPLTSCSARFYCSERSEQTDQWIFGNRSRFRTHPGGVAQ